MNKPKYKNKYFSNRINTSNSEINRPKTANCINILTNIAINNDEVIDGYRSFSEKYFFNIII